MGGCVFVCGYACVRKFIVRSCDCPGMSLVAEFSGFLFSLIPMFAYVPVP